MECHLSQSGWWRHESKQRHPALPLPPPLLGEHQYVLKPAEICKASSMSIRVCMLHIKCLYECVWVVFVCHWFCLVCTLSFFKCTGSTAAYKFKVTYLGFFFLSVWHCAHCVCRWWLKLKWFTCSAFRRKKKKHRSRICPFQEPPLNTWTSRQVCAIVSWVFIQEAAQTHYSRWGRERERCVINTDFNINLFIHCQITTIVTTRHCSPLLTQREV